MKRTLLVTAFVGATLLSMQVTQAQIYREVFGNLAAGSGGTNAAPSSVGWAGNWGGLNADPITAFGLYSDATDSLGNTENGIRRFDTYQIDTVPEPSSVVLA